MKFPYIKIPTAERCVISGKSHCLKPIIPIQISANGQSIRYEALIDSGADASIFHADIGEILGIDIESGAKWIFGGIQNSKKPSVGYAHTVTISVGGYLHPTRVVFSRDISVDGYGILGQAGFFDLFSIKFDLCKEEIELKDKS